MVPYIKKRTYYRTINAFKKCVYCIVFIIVMLIVVRPGFASEKVEMVIDTGHTDSVSSVYYFPNGKYVASAGSDKSLIIWDIEKSSVKYHFRNAVPAYDNVLFSSSGNTLITAYLEYKKSKVIFWDIATGKKINEINVGFIKGKWTSVNAISLSQDGKVLAAEHQYYGKGRVIILWDIFSGKKIRELNGYQESTMIKFSPDGNTLAAVGKEGGVVIWDIPGGKMLHNSVSKSKIINVAIFSGAKGYIVIESNGGKTVSLLDIYSSNIIHSAKIITEVPPWAKGDIAVTKFSHDGRMLAIIKEYNSIVLLETDTGKVLHELNSSMNPISNIEFTSDGAVLAATDDAVGIGVWDVSTGKILHNIRDWSQKLSFSPDGEYIFSVSNNIPKQWEVSSGKLIKSFGGDYKFFHHIASSNNGDAVAIAGVADLAVELWRPLDRRNNYTLKVGSPSCLKFSSDGKLLATGTLGQEIIIWDALTGNKMKTMNVKGNDESTRLGVVNISFSPIDNNIASVYEDGTIQVWDLKKGRPYKTLSGKHGNYYDEFSYSPDGEAILSVGYDKISLIDVANDKVIRKIDVSSKNRRKLGSPIHSKTAEFSPIGKTLAYANDEKIILMDVMTGNVVNTLSSNTISTVTYIKYSNDGKKLLSASDDMVIKLWDVKKGVVEQKYHGHNEKIIYLNYISSGNIFFSSDIKQAKYWNLKGFNELASFTTFYTPFEGLGWLAYTPDGYFDGSNSAWQVSSFKLINQPQVRYNLGQFFSLFYQPDLLGDIVSHGVAISDLLIRQGGVRRAINISTLKDSKIPNILIDDHKKQVIRRNVVLNITARDNGSGLQDMRVFRNGTLVHRVRGNLSAKKSFPNFHLAVPLKLSEGENVITAYIFNSENVRSDIASTNIEWVKNRSFFGGYKKTVGNAYVITFGVNKYANKNYGQLKYAVADAVAMREEIFDAISQIGTYKKVTYVEFLDNETTRDSFLAVLNRLSGKKTEVSENILTKLESVKPANPEDAVFVFFSGHGASSVDRYHLIPSHGDAISDKDIELGFEKVDSDNIMLIIDACYSGKTLESKEKRLGPMNSYGLAQLAYEKGMYVLAASQSDEYANEVDKLGHGILTYALIEEGLRNGLADTHPKDNIITVREWFDYAVKRVPELTESEIKRISKRKTKSIRFISSNKKQAPRAYYRRGGNDNWIIKRQ